MKVISWNVQGRVGGSLASQVRALLDRKPDVVALQELTLSSLPRWQQELTNAGYHVVSSEHLLALPYPPPPLPSEWFHPGRVPTTQIKRKNFNLTAARHPLTSLAGLSFDDPEEQHFAFPEKYLAARVTFDGRIVDIHNAHLPPGSSRGLIKVHAFEAIHRRVAQDGGTPRVLCGDFNAPLTEDSTGPNLAAVAPGPQWPESINKRWIEAEAGIVKNPDMRDVYRDVHDPAGELFPVSHYTGRKEPLTPHRYDYIFASRELETAACEYLSDWLNRDEEGWRLSDHAPVEAELLLSALLSRPPQPSLGLSSPHT